MTAAYHPLRALLFTVSGWVHREQKRTIEYLVEENRVLKEQFKGRKLRLTDDQRGRLAAKGKQLGRRLLNRAATNVTPDTIMRWHKRLIAAKCTYKQQRTGRRGVIAEIKKLAIRFARENSGWGYSRIQGALEDLGHRVGRTTVSRILKAKGIKPAPDRPSSWKTCQRKRERTLVRSRLPLLRTPTAPVEATEPAPARPVHLEVPGDAGCDARPQDQ